MASNKENNSSASGGGGDGGPSPSPSPSPNSKLANSTKALSMSSSLYEDDDEFDLCKNYWKSMHFGVQGGCSTCCSVQHDTVYCDRKHETPAELVMSGALQSGVEEESSSAAQAQAQGTANTTGTSTAATSLAEKSAEARFVTLPRQRIGRRHSV